MIPDDQDLLRLDRYLDGVLGTEERIALAERLTSDEAFRRWFCAEVRLQGQIAGLLPLAGTEEAEGRSLWQRIRTGLETLHPHVAQDLVAGATKSVPSAAPHAVPAALVGRAPPLPRPSRRHARAGPRSGWRQPWLVLAAALVVGAVIATVVQRLPSAAQGHVLVVAWDGPVHCGGRALDASSPPVSLPPHTLVEVGDQGRALLRWNDGTEIHLAAHTRASWREEGPQELQIELASGTLHAAIAHQPPGHAVVFLTPDARARVIGTQLDLVALASGSQLTVTAGRVAFGPRDPRQPTVEVAAGEEATVAGGRVAHALTYQPPVWAKAVAALVPPQPPERRWQRIPWRTDLQQARREATHAGRPLLLWVGWGDPLGMACSECLSDRRQVWGVPALAHAAAAFVPVACDSWFLLRATGADARFFAALVRQSPHPGPGIHTGIYACTAAGQLLGFVACGEPPERVLSMLAAATAAPAGRYDAGIDLAAPATAVPSPPVGTLVLSVFSRRLEQDGDHLALPLRSTREDAPDAAIPGVGQEVLWIAPPVWQALLPPHPQLGQHLPCPRAFALALACNGLLDATQGEATPWEPQDLQRQEMDLTVLEVAPDQILLSLAGHITLRDDHRAIDATVEGAIAYDLVHDRLTRCDLAILGAEPLTGALSDAVTKACLGLAISIAQPPDTAAHPHAARAAAAQHEREP